GAPTPAPEPVRGHGRGHRVRRAHGRGRRLLTVALVLFIGLVGLTVFGAVTVLPGGTGDRNFRPTSWDAVQDRYRLGAGELVLDLRELPALEADRSVEIDLGMGHIEVRVPDDL